MRRGARLIYVLGRDRDAFSAAALRRGVPDLAGRDVYLCGPPGLMAAVRRSLREAALPRSSCTRSGSASEPLGQAHRFRSRSRSRARASARRSRR